MISGVFNRESNKDKKRWHIIPHIFVQPHCSVCRSASVRRSVSPTSFCSSATSTMQMYSDGPAIRTPSRRIWTAWRARESFSTGLIVRTPFRSRRGPLFSRGFTPERPVYWIITNRKQKYCRKPCRCSGFFRRTVTRPTLSANGIFLEKRMKAGLSVVSITVKIQPITTTSNGSENKATRRSSVKIGPRSSENFRRGISWKALNIRKPGWAPGRQNFRPTRPWKPSLPGIRSKSSASTHVRTSRSSASPRSIVPISPIRLFLNIWPITTMPHGGRAQMQEGRSPCRRHSASRPRIYLRHWLVSGQTKREYGVSD